VRGKYEYDGLQELPNCKSHTMPILTLILMIYICSECQIVVCPIALNSELAEDYPNHILV